MNIIVIFVSWAHWCLKIRDDNQSLRMGGNEVGCFDGEHLRDGMLVQNAPPHSP